MPDHRFPQSAAKRSPHLRALDAFLVDNPQLEQLSARLARFNLFRVLSIEHAEIRHSNMLAWLLDPGGEHGLGPNMLRRFISRLLMANPGVPITLSPARIELADFSDVEVMREWRSIDVLVHSAKGKWCLAIENKIHAGESAGQLKRYRDAIREEMPGVEVIPVLLSLQGADPSNDGKAAGYIPWSHVDVLELVEETFTQHRSRVPPDAALLLEHYIDTLRRLTMQDEQLVRLCKDIYRKHREAIDLINEYGTASRVIDACELWVNSVKGLEWCANRQSRVWFVPSEMSQVMPEVNVSWPFLPKRYPVIWWFHHRALEPKLQLSMEVGPIGDAVRRQRLLAAIQAAGFKFWEGGLKEGAKFTRVLTEMRKIALTDDDEPTNDEKKIAQAAEELWQRAWGKGKGIVDVLRVFDWGEPG